ncbi:MAG: hypothetical protein ACXWW0_00215 [Bacteroidia bacterium]
MPQAQNVHTPHQSKHKYAELNDYLEDQQPLEVAFKVFKLCSLVVADADSLDTCREELRAGMVLTEKLFDCAMPAQLIKAG